MALIAINKFTYFVLYFGVKVAGFNWKRELIIKALSCTDIANRSVKALQVETTYWGWGPL